MGLKQILFNTEMVRAILDNRKSATRRVIKFKNDKQKYKVGDILYVRETWAEISNYDKSHRKFVYRATDAWPFGALYVFKFRWKPSIHMPKTAARIFLRVTDVRKEKLQDIRYYEAHKEGIDCFEICNYECEAEGTCANNQFKGNCKLIHAFKNLWNSTMKKSELGKYGWDANPRVWVYKFKVISKEEAYKESGEECQ